MHNNKFLLATLLFLPFVAQAASSVSIESTGCSGSLPSALGEEVFLLCSGGDLPSRRTLPTGSGGALQISPGGDLSLYSGGGIAAVVGSSDGAILRTGSGGALQISPGGGISLTGGGRIVLINPGGVISQHIGGDITGAVVGPSGGNSSLRVRSGIVTLASPVPEPGATSMMLVGLLALLGVGAGRKRRGSGLLS